MTAGQVSIWVHTGIAPCAKAGPDVDMTPRINRVAQRPTAMGLHISSFPQRYPDIGCLRRLGKSGVAKMMFGQVTRRLISAVFLAGLTLLSASHALSAPKPTAAERAAIAVAETRGQQIYAYDQAAWHSTDELQRLVPPTSFPKSDGGWVVEPNNDFLRVSYYNADSGVPQAFFQADVRGKKVVASRIFAGTDDRNLSPRALRMIAARTVAIGALGKDNTFCTSGRPNNVALAPVSDASTIMIYFLSAQVTTGEYPLGGHYRIEVAPEGGVLSSRGFMTSCMNSSPPDNPAAILFVTHLLDPTPTEIHVWMSLWMNKTLMVMTGPNRMWEVTVGKIKAVSSPPPKGAWQP
jgi:hypothetical protein